MEGIGEDFLPSTTDLSMIDEIVRVTDKESFLMTRQLVKEEGIFAGGSSGSALSAALKYAKDFPAERIVVVLLPDTGARYLSKVFDDKWMRENGYLDTEWGEVSLSVVLDEKQSQNLITASVTDSMSDVISLMKVNDISQVLTLNPDGSPAGLVREIDLLKHLLDNQHKHNGSEPIVNILQPMPPTFPAHTRLEEVMTAIVESNVIIVMEGKEMLGILSKIDILDFISQ